MHPIYILVILLIAMSAVCSGLNVSLMALKTSDLRRKAQLGDAKAKRVVKLRENSHLSLAAILLTNVAVISASSLALAEVFNGLVAGLASTILIVIFGEIFPQAFFLKNPLKVTSFLSPILRVMIVITYPISKPLQLLLDKLFPHDDNKLHSRQELGLMITEHLGRDDSELDEDEVEIIRGALQLSETQVSQIMTPLNQVYHLRLDDVIDGVTIDQIKQASFSRIPLFNDDKTAPVGLLLMKDLVDIDFNERSYKVRELPIRPLKLVGSKTALDTMFRKFLAAHTHLMAIERNNHIVGVVTIEDLLEQILGQEIEDETDMDRAKSATLGI